MERMSEMKSEQLKQLLIEIFPGECESVGPEILDDLVLNNVDFERSDYGRRYDLPDLDTLREALTILKLILEISGIMKKDRKRNPSKDELEKEVNKRKLSRNSVSDEELSKLIEKASEVDKSQYPPQHERGQAEGKKTKEAKSDRKG